MLIFVCVWQMNRLTGVHVSPTVVFNVSLRRDSKASSATWTVFDEGI